ncbi:MAG: hypothetical protein ABIN67_19760 [Ferruginibacter sp.]
MDINEILIDNESLITYVGEYTVVPNLRELVQQAQDANPEVQPLALRPINVERTVDQLAERGITTIGALDAKLNEHKDELINMFNTYESGAIAARHVFTPIYLLLEIE